MKRKKEINISNIAALIIPIVLAVDAALYFFIVINYGPDVFIIRSEVKHYLKSQYDIQAQILDVDYSIKDGTYTVEFRIQGDDSNSKYISYKHSDDSLDDTYAITFWKEKIEREVYQHLQGKDILNIEKPVLVFGDGMNRRFSSYSSLVDYYDKIALHLSFDIEDIITEQDYQGIIEVTDFMKEKEYKITQLICTFKQSGNPDKQIIIENPLVKELNIDDLSGMVH